MSEQNYRDLRREYEAGELRRAMLQATPLAQFQQWLAEAREHHPDDATSMTLSTVDAEGWPEARIVLLKHCNEDGFSWYTDSRSRKGQALAAHPRAELLFYWRGMERQVRIQGEVVQLPAEHAENYFNSRPLGSRLSAAASVQSAAVADRAVLEQRIEELKQAHPQEDIPRPDAWIGYLLQPRRFEFWQGRASRLHDRFEYRLLNGEWQIDRLSP
ncbi:pyridoxamine 5'-phosphate oxidase [Pokkaliibacter sp. MBI-7]|uniref:pyridoxamine 5'-phosphate oxidase n=1 Tax=Pokkaliibacter sp. MBI-7 TaxID=3040600 RepID=UPI002448F8A1|nr:pyridoxamine 5'-phosphate oxidase [Pokkaliibacter sp. MBI-7]MDH2432005.1 pyridoxamine 5'-phosphate oxidase [Pokkaliibacter sp. MBI-7]